MKALRALLAAALLAVNSAAWADLSGPVIAILDGDTVDILVNSRPVRIRLLLVAGF